MREYARVIRGREVVCAQQSSSSGIMEETISLNININIIHVETSRISRMRKLVIYICID